jgi:hypothetical protein
MTFLSPVTSERKYTSLQGEKRTYRRPESERLNLVLEHVLVHSLHIILNIRWLALLLDSIFLLISVVA